MLTTTLLWIGEVRCLYGGGYTVNKRGPKTGNYHSGLACLFKVGMKTKGWLGDRGRSRIVLNRVLGYGRGFEVRMV